ncbi:hypothetical protein J2S06_001357 [Bacillus alveayuensis]|jgi:hypothetical protein|uniref:Uncharacterized protein n=1 Tax=Aeribacillus alveayuensis TaxID=279215 RepID=A0ABT9VMU3_9BACI|nr:hypothetical protein [Bacillus alveayuensis]
MKLMHDMLLNVRCEGFYIMQVYFLPLHDFYARYFSLFEHLSSFLPLFSFANRS